MPFYTMEVQGSQSVSPLPSFYKIILPGIISQKKLRIPTKFAETFGHELSGDIALVLPDGCLWHVKLERSDNMICFSDGWQKLVDHYSISSGHVLIFEYGGNSSFKVSIYDITSTKIEYDSYVLGSCAGPESFEGFCVSDGEETESDLDCLTSRMRSLKSRDNCAGNSKRGGKKVKTSLEKGKQVMPEKVGKPRKHSMNAAKTKQASSRVANGKDGSGGRESLLTRKEEAAKLGIKACFVDFLRSTLLTTQEKELAIIAGKEYTSYNPCFMAVIRQCNLHKAYQMDAPVEFSAKYLLPPKRVELETADGKRWTVYSTGINRGLGGATLKRGWATFVRANHLQIGDICIFEVIQANYVVLKVSIYKSKQDD